MLTTFVISISISDDRIETIRSRDEVREAYSDRLIVSFFFASRDWVVKMDRIEGDNGELACTWGCKAVFDTGQVLNV